MDNLHHSDKPDLVDRPDLIEILQKLGKKVCESRKEYVSPIVTYSSTEGVLIDITLYVLAPEIKYEYRVLNVEILNVSSLRITFFTLKTKQAEHRDIDISKGLERYENETSNFLRTPLFTASLDFLVNQVSLKREHRGSPIRDKIVVGQARVAILTTGQEISVGFQRIDGDEVIYYTGRGLREIWKPSNAQEQARAEQLKQQSEQNLINMGYMERRRISEFRDIL